MKQYGLGPNGGIVTSLNLFSMAFDQVNWIIFVSSFVIAALLTGFIYN